MSDKTKEASERVRDALQALGEIIGPRRCAHETDWANCDLEECTYDMTEPYSGSLMIEEFTIVCSWWDMEKGERFTMNFWPDGQPRPRTKGLLWVALEEF